MDFSRSDFTYTFPGKIYGLVDYKNKEIKIYGINNADLHLIKFSLAHEISHLILHSSLLKSGKDSFYYFCENTKASKRMEKQANLLASYIILDDDAFKEMFIKTVQPFYLTPQRGYYLYLDSQECNVKQFLKITDKLMYIFDVSRDVIKVRLMELGWLKLPENKFNFLHPNW